MPGMAKSPMQGVGESVRELNRSDLNMLAAPISREKAACRTDFLFFLELKRRAGPDRYYFPR